MSTRVAVILPRKETFSRERFGAISLTVEDYVRHSAHRDEIEVLGMAATAPRLPEVFRAITPEDRWWRRRNIGFAAGCVAHLGTSPARFIEVHNRIEVFHYLARRLPDARVTLWLHNDPLTMRAAKSSAARGRILARAHRVMCVSEWVRERFIGGLTGGTERVVVLPNAMAPMPDATSEKESLILFVGRLIEDKGVHLLAAALAQALPALPHWRAVMVGTGSARMTARLKDILASVRDQVSLPGFVPHEEVMALFARAAIAVVPSVWDEPFGRTALEAMVAGCAVIASGTGGLREVVGDAGLVVAPVTAEALAAAITGLTSDDARRRALQARAQTRAAAAFAITAWAARWDALYG